MSAGFDEDGRRQEDVYRGMWENYDDDWGFNALNEGGDDWDLWNLDPAANDWVRNRNRDLPDSSSSPFENFSPPREPGAPSMRPRRDSLAREDQNSISRQLMGNTPSAQNTHAQPQPHREAERSTNTHTTNQRRATEPQHSEDWLDRLASRQQQQHDYSHLPDDFFDPASEDDFSDFSNGFDIDDLLPSDWEDEMAPTTRRQQNRNQPIDLTNDPSSPPQNIRSGRNPISLKRSAEQTTRDRPPKRTRVADSGVKVEELDLTNEAPSAEEELLQTQQEKAIKAQQAAAAAASALPVKIGKKQCIICMEPFTNATTTSCGHMYCHECLTQALIAGEKNSDRGIGNCPVCRKPVNRKKANQVIPIAFMKRSAFKGKGRRDVGLLG